VCKCMHLFAERAREGRRKEEGGGGGGGEGGSFSISSC
jgi:hypothetical protein